MAPHHFCMIFENATGDKTVKSHPVCLKFAVAGAVVNIDAFTNINIEMVNIPIVGRVDKFWRLL